MLPRLSSAMCALAVVLAACDASITAPTSQRLTTVALGDNFSCGLIDDGRAFCWGPSADRGQMGDGINAPHSAPTAVKSGMHFTQIAVGKEHACALDADGRVFCWGDNQESELGVVDADLDCSLLQSNGWTQDFGNECSIVPVPVQTRLRFTQIAIAGWHTCGLTGDGDLWCWGSGSVPLGDEAGTMVTDIPVRVASTVPFRHFATGLYHSCASDSDGLGSCWGYNTDGSLGLGTADSLTGSSSTPRRINSSAYLTALAVGDAHTCALTSAGEALCWGAGADGQRGDSTAGWARNDPTFAATTTRFTRIAAGASSTCALESGTGAAWCWGENSNGQLGDGTTFDRLAPTKVLGGLSFTSLSMLGGSGGSDNFAPGPICAGGAGRMYCWGLLPQPLTFEE